MKKFLLSLACVLMTVLSSLATTVYFENTSNWAKVYAYAWTPNNASWPGVQVTTTIEASGRTFYAYELPGAQPNIIFNNGGNGAQTKDLKVVDGAVYSGANASSIDAIGSIVDGEFHAAGDVVVEYATIYVAEATCPYNKCYIYSWSPSLFGDWPGSEMTKTEVNGANYWSIKIDKREIEGVTVGGWKVSNGSGWESTNNTKGTVFEDGKVYSLTSGTGTEPSNQPVEIEYATIYVAVSTWNYADCYIYSWEPSLFGGWPGSQMTKVTVEGQDYWSIKIDKALIEDVTVGGWKLNAGEGQAESVNNEKGTVFEDGKVYNLTSGEGSELGAVVVPTDPWADYNLAIHGEIFGDPNWSSMNLEKVDDGQYELTAKLVAGNFGLKVMDVESGEQVNWVGGGAAIDEENTVYNFNAGDNSSSTLAGNYTIKYNSLENTIEFVPYGGVIDEVVTYAVKGTICGADWALYDMTEDENGKWSVTLTVQEGDFGIAELTNGAQSNWYFGTEPAVEGENTVTPMVEVGNYNCVTFGGSNWHSTLEGEYIFTFDPATDVLNVDLASGVDAISVAEEGAAVYYNMQGVRVANPSNGLYIRVAAGKAVKVVL